MNEYAPDKSQEPLICANCGDEASSLLGGECIHKCSNAVEKEELRELVEVWREKGDTLIHELDSNSYREGRGGQLAECARQLEALLEE